MRASRVKTHRKTKQERERRQRAIDQQCSTCGRFMRNHGPIFGWACIHSYYDGYEGRWNHE